MSTAHPAKRGRSALVCALAAVLFAWLVIAAPAAAAAPGDRLFYTVVTEPGSPAFFDTLPALSADGSTLAYLGQDQSTKLGPFPQNGDSLYLARGDFHAGRKIADTVAYRPALSADGTHIAFLGWDGAALQAMAYDATSGTTTQLSTGDQTLVNAMISGDGRAVFWHSWDGMTGTGLLHMAPFDGSAVATVVATSHAAYFGFSSVDGSGRHVAYMDAPATNPWVASVWVLDTSTMSTTQLTFFPSDVTAFDVMLSADGSRAAVLSQPAYSGTPGVIRAWSLSVPDGTGGSCPVASDSFISPSGFVATQDARHLFFSALPAGAYTDLSRGQSREDIWEINLDDCSIVQVTDNSLAPYQPAVSADGSVLAFASSTIGSIVVATPFPTGAP